MILVLFTCAKILNLYCKKSNLISQTMYDCFSVFVLFCYSSLFPNWINRKKQPHIIALSSLIVIQAKCKCTTILHRKKEIFPTPTEKKHCLYCGNEGRTIPPMFALSLCGASFHPYICTTIHRKFVREDEVAGKALPGHSPPIPSITDPPTATKAKSNNHFQNTFLIAHDKR